MSRPVVLGVFLLASSVPALSAQRLPYPASPVGPVTDDYHGSRIADPFRWLEDTDSPETAAWAGAQNRLTFGYLEGLPNRGHLRERLTRLWNYERFGVPFREGDGYFYTWNSGLQNQSVLHVTTALADRGRVLLDPNTLSDDGTVALTAAAVSPDGRLLAYGTAVSGSDWQEFHVRDVATGRDLPDTLRWVKFSGMSWTRDNAGFFYSRYPEPEGGNRLLAVNRNQHLYYHRLGTPQSEDRLVFAPEDPEWFVGAAVTEDGRYAVLSLGEGTDPRNRVYYLDLGTPDAPDLGAPIVKLFDAFDASYQVLGNDGETWYILTDRDAPRKRIVAVDLAAPSPLRTVVPEAMGGEVLEGAALVRDRIVAEYLHDARSDLRLFGLDGTPRGTVALPTAGSVGGISARRQDGEFFYAFTSYLFPSTIYRYDLARGESEVFRAPTVDFAASRYETRQIFATSRDGTRVPLFVTHRKGIALDGSHPALLYGYGGFNISLTPGFSVSTAVWLEQGGVYVVANLRGGGEYGEEWHLAGTKERKQNVFDDFIAAAEHLVAAGYTRPDRLAIQGGSNGGLLVGAVTNQRPDLFGVALPAVGVMDMLRFHRFTIGSAWTSDYGSADDPEGFRYLRAYSPLHNITPGTCYPATLITTADHDDRVVPGHSFKYAATLQRAQGCTRPTLIRIETKAGHGAGKPVSKQIEEAADLWAFALTNLGMQPAVP